MNETKMTTRMKSIWAGTKTFSGEERKQVFTERFLRSLKIQRLTKASVPVIHI
jgi:hypothetical protein